MLAGMVLRHTDNLSRALQHQTMSAAAAGQEIAQMTVKTLQYLRNDECFGLFWAQVTLAADHMEVDEPQLPRQHKQPKRYEVGSSEGSFHSTLKDYYRQHYFEAIDLIITCNS